MEMKGGIYCFGRYRLDISARTVLCANDPCHLTPLEFEILKALVLANGSTLSRHALIDAVWPYDKPAEPEANLYQHLRSLRKKLPRDNSSEGWIKNIHGRGYCLAQAAQKQSYQNMVGIEPKFLVGRDDAIATLDTHFQRALAGEGHMICVIAEPGVGKTALIEAFLSKACGLSGMHVGKGQCRLQLQSAQPYQAWFDIVAGLASADEDVRRLLQSTASHWWNQLQGSERSEQSATLSTLRRELERFLAALTASRPVILFIDDLHWADAATIDLLNHILPALQSQTIILFAAYRGSDMLIRRGPFLSVEAELKIKGLCCDLPLQELSLEAAQMYLDRRFPGHQFPSSVSESLFEASGGNALCINDMVRHAVQRGWIVHRDERWRFAKQPSVWRTELPDSVAAMATKKLEELHEFERHLLWVSSLQGVVFDSLVSARAVGGERVDIEDRLNRMSTEHQILRRSNTEDHPASGAAYEFAHVLYFDAVRQLALDAQRIEFSKRTAGALIAVHGRNNEAIAPILARLFEDAAVSHRALEFYLVAVRRALRLSAFRQAYDLAEHAAQLAARANHFKQTARYELELLGLKAMALSSLHGFGFEALEEICSRSRSLADQLGNQSASARVELIHWAFVASNDISHSLKIATRLRNRTRASKNREDKANGLFSVGVSLIHCGRFGAATRTLGRSLLDWQSALGPKIVPSGGFYQPLAILCNQARALCFSGQLEQGQRTVLGAWEMATQLNHAKSKAYVLALVADIYHMRRDGENTVQWADQAIELAREFEFPYEMTWATVFKAAALIELGDPEAAYTLIEAPLKSYYGPCKTKFWRHAAWACSLAGSLEKGLAILDETFRSGGQTGERYYDAELLRTRGELLLRTPGDGKQKRDQIRDSFKSALALARQQGSMLFELRALTSLVHFDLSYNRKPALKKGSQDLSRLLLKFRGTANTPDVIDAQKLLREAGVTIVRSEAAAPDPSISRLT